MGNLTSTEFVAQQLTCGGFIGSAAYGSSDWDMFDAFTVHEDSADEADAIFDTVDFNSLDFDSLESFAADYSPAA